MNRRNLCLGPFFAGDSPDPFGGGQGQNRVFFGKVQGNVEEPGKLILGIPQFRKFSKGPFPYATQQRVIVSDCLAVKLGPEYRKPFSRRLFPKGKGAVFT
jgi:hypothetical protein